MTDINKLITENIDIWSGAIKKRSATGRGYNKKVDLVGIKKLRELILELAVKGKLTKQDPSNESAAELLARIKLTREELVKRKLIKKPKNLPDIEEHEKYCELPHGWEFVRLNDLGEWGAGATPKRGNPEFYGGDIPWFKSGELSSDFITQSEETVTELALQKTSLRYNKKGDVLLAMYGATIGKASILGISGTTNQAVCACTPFEGFHNRYLLTLLKAFRPKFIGMGAGGAQPNISREKIIATVIALPPIKEQEQIVIKVNELMALCDQLEQQTEASIDAHQLLVEELLSTLINSGSAQAFEQNWARIAEHFDLLFTTEHSIEQLKQTILQLAVMGKLVPQEPNDVPASKLLEKIAQEKEQLIKDKVIKRQKALPEISEEEKKIPIPRGWEWCRLQDITSKITDGDHKTPPRLNAGKTLLSAKNVRDGYVCFENTDFISQEDFDKSRERCLPEEGDLMIVSVGGTIGRSSLVSSNSDFALVRSVALIKPIGFNSQYLKLTADSPLLQQSIHENKRGGAQPCLYLSEISKFCFPLPPLGEQQRIVKKANELISLCEQLKNCISNIQFTKIQTADSLVEQVLK